MRDFLGQIRQRIECQEIWLRANAPQVVAEQKHLDENTTERAYWHYGYMVALRDIEKILNAETLN